MKRRIWTIVVLLISKEVFSLKILHSTSDKKVVQLGEETELVCEADDYVDSCNWYNTVENSTTKRQFEAVILMGFDNCS